MHSSHFELSYAPNYSDHIRRIIPFYDRMVREIMGALGRCHGAEARIVELGCGNGPLIAEMLARGARTVVGVDYSETVLEFVATRFAARIDDGSLVLVPGDITDPATWASPALAEPADAVVASLIFHDLEPAQRMDLFEHVARTLRPGGLFCFVDAVDRGPDLDRDVHAWAQAMALNPDEIAELRADDPRLFEPVTQDELRRLANDAGFTHVEEAWSLFHFSLDLYALAA